MSASVAYYLAMKRRTLFCAITLAAASLLFAQESWLGEWGGSLGLSEGSMAFSLTVGPGGALLDLPEQNLYGYPSVAMKSSDGALEIAWLFGGGQFLLSVQPDGEGALGLFGQGTVRGSVAMHRSAQTRREGLELSFPSSDGTLLPGTLLMPETGDGKKPPLVILHAGLGFADRDGNSYSLAGRNDALRQLALALAKLGVASYRYDKRGAGMATWLVAREADLRFKPWVADLSACLGHFAADGRFSSLWVLGQGDGALVAAQAALESPHEAGLIVACASADGPLDAYIQAVNDAPEEQRAEGQALLAALRAGRLVKGPSSFYAQAFRESFQPYLIEAFAHDLETQLAAYEGQLLIIQGDRDMQATFGDFTKLGDAAPTATGAVIPLMNHVLKAVPPEVDLNNLAFSDPSFPIAPGLAELVARTLGLEVELPF